ncbi:MAG: ABC transporter permease [Hydrogenibacillus sp.]|nr:ABC transporter permease [Hydrogenibacillus sp.]
MTTPQVILSGDPEVSPEVLPVQSGPGLIRRLFAHRFFQWGMTVLALLILLAVFGPTLSPYEPNTTVLGETLKPPSREHWFGTDDLGRDVFTRVAYGARISLWVGLAAVSGAVVIGTLLGLLAGYFGRWVDSLISRMFDIMFAFPSILLAIAIVAVMGGGLIKALIAVSIINIPTFGRLVRSRVQQLVQEEFVQAARTIGLGDGTIIIRHVLPNTFAPIIVQGSLGIATAILEAAALGFLGLGAQRPTPEWGRMLSDAREYFQNAPWTVFFPGLLIMLTVLAFNMIGDALRDVLDPRMKS